MQIHAVFAALLLVKSVVDGAVAPVMKQNDIHGMAVGIVAGGRTHVFNYGFASMAPRRPVTDETLFELGSVSKTLTATLVSYAQVTGHLSLSDKTSTFLPSLAGTAFGDATLLELGTHTPGGLPLQVPDSVTSLDGLMAFLRAWRPAYASGTERTYSNISTTVLGMIAAKSLDRDFVSLMQQRVFPALGMTHTYIRLPETATSAYAQGYTKDDAPVRMSPGVLRDEAYGVRTTASDMLRFVAENMSLLPLDDAFQRALTQTHTGYFTDGDMTQDLMWEQYAYPVTLDALLTGNSYAVIFKPTAVQAIAPPERPTEDAWINKTGSTNGFGAYVAFVPKQRLGIVILANKNFPIPDRVKLAYRILTQLAQANRR